MKLKLLLATILLSTISAFSQTNFQPGYIIQTNGTKVNCLIKNEDWKGSPTSFIYKLEENGDTKIGNLNNVAAFGAAESYKYVNATVQIDQSTDNVDKLSYSRNPEMKEEKLFLKVLVEGKVSLFYTQINNNPRYFYNMDQGEIVQLIYKRFLVTNLKMGKNERFKQQLATDLICTNLKENSFSDLEYKMNSLVNLITKYNNCVDSENVIYNKNRQSAKFNLSLRPGITFSSLSLQKNSDEPLDFDMNTGIRIGLEAEYVLPINNGKWSIFIEPTYRNYTAEKSVLYASMITFQKYTLVTANYSSIELPIGGRHYMFLNQDAAFFIDAAIIMDISTLDSEITSSNEASYDLDVSADATFGLGLGFRYKNKYSIEARYHNSRKIVNYLNIDSDYNSFALIAGYNFL